MKTFEIPTAEITDWSTFHKVFGRVMGFPSFYGRNMNAWIDCMSDLDEPEAGTPAGMTKNIGLKSGEELALRLGDTEDFSKRLPEILTALIECTAFVNQRYITNVGKPIILLAFT